MGPVASILVKLAVAVLAYYQGRADYRALVLEEVKNAGLQLALEAERFKVAAGRDPTLQRFGVRHPAPKPKRLSSKDAGSHD